MDREQWLNGWMRDGSEVCVYGEVRCAGCGRSHGTYGVVVPDGWNPPERLPDWPFNEDTCPVDPERHLSPDPEPLATTVGPKGWLP